MKTEYDDEPGRLEQANRLLAQFSDAHNMGMRLLEMSEIVDSLMDPRLRLVSEYLAHMRRVQDEALYFLRRPKGYSPEYEAAQ